MTEPAGETTEAVLRRIRIISVGSYFVFAAALFFTMGWRAVAARAALPHAAAR